MSHKHVRKHNGCTPARGFDNSAVTALARCVLAIDNGQTRLRETEGRADPQAVHRLEIPYAYEPHRRISKGPLGTERLERLWHWGTRRVQAFRLPEHRDPIGHILLIGLTSLVDAPDELSLPPGPIRGECVEISGG